MMTFTSLNAAIPDFNYGTDERHSFRCMSRSVYRPQLPSIDKRRLLSLIDDWKENTSHFSTRRARIEHPLFKQIVSFGSSAVPVIIDDLKSERSFLFNVLEEITKEDPVLDAQRGNIAAVVGAWVKWFELSFETMTEV
jgi:hypothetical protein